MGATEMRNELQKYLELGDADLLKVLHETALVYIKNNRVDVMINEGEEDIAKGKLHSQDEVQEMIEFWTEK